MDRRVGFLHGDIDEELYIKRPNGFRILENEHLVCIEILVFNVIMGRPYVERATSCTLYSLLRNGCLLDFAAFTNVVIC